MVVRAGGGDVDRAPGLHGEALQRVRQQREREAADALAGERERDLCVRPPDEVDGRGCARLVHRDRRRPVASNALPVAERLGQSVAERSENVLHGVVLVHIEVTARDELEIEAGVERPEREQVVEEPDARGAEDSA